MCNIASVESAHESHDEDVQYTGPGLTGGTNNANPSLSIDEAVCTPGKTLLLHTDYGELTMESKLA